MVRRFTRRTTRRNTKRVYRKKSRRSTSKRITRRRPQVSNKRILNVSTTKKSDTLLGAPQPATPLTFFDVNGVQIPGQVGDFSVYMWCPTYRQNGATSAYNRRGKTRTYFRGIKENVELFLPSACPLQWRRIVVSSPLNVVNTVSYDTANVFQQGRTQTPQFSSYFAFLEVIMQGTFGIDYNNHFTAKIDTKRARVMYDKVRTISPKTTKGAIQKFKFWHPVNKSLIYDDEEEGGNINSSPWAVQSPGNDNVYVIDLFANFNAALTTERARWAVQSTVYWHER